MARYWRTSLCWAGYDDNNDNDDDDDDDDFNLIFHYKYVNKFTKCVFNLNYNCSLNFYKCNFGLTNMAKGGHIGGHSDGYIVFCGHM